MEDIEFEIKNNTFLKSLPGILLWKKLLATPSKRLKATVVKS
jgi:hypothetical protein